MASYDAALTKIYEERLTSFYRKYDPSKIASVGSLLVKYKGNEEKLLRAMVSKYGPEPTPDELADDDDEDDGDDDDGDDDDDDDETAAASKRGPKDRAGDAIDDDDGRGKPQSRAADEDDDDDDDAAAQPDKDEALVYCAVCGLPPEYCEYSAEYDKCVPWIEEHCPHLLKKAADDEAADGAADKKKKSKRGGGVVKKKQSLPEDKMRVVVYTEVRSRKKTVTVIEGLETLGVKLKDASKLFGRKFACSSSVKDKDAGGAEIVVQGDIIFDLPDLLRAEYSIPRDKLFTKDAGKVVPLR
eukprot:CAMPEP_0185703810 /NCGR_PEP_ID=MMETSP1164-20130828/15479_1 /TAXON_ID=1104430 /ORGANISM="Chrysoreinhardia sp, Strain CCMP2950" /LENGTH=298 /DNA_ID=CAMNT_0028371123 /DNA_START=15 /DNA_END=911 /DNA_ORIENTATION=+